MYTKLIELQNCSIIFKLEIESYTLFSNVANAFSHLFSRKYKTGSIKSKVISIFTRNEVTDIFFGDILYLSCEKNNTEIVLSAIIDIISDSLKYFPKSFSFYHSYVVTKQKDAILLVAPTHQGKTTIGTALTLSGYLYLADDVAIFNEKGKLIPFLLPIKLRKTSLLSKSELFKKYHIISTENYDFLVPKQNISGFFSPQKVVFLKRECDGENKVNVVELDKFEALHRLIINASYCENIFVHTLSSKTIVENCNKILEITYNRGLDILKYI